MIRWFQLTTRECGLRRWRGGQAIMLFELIWGDSGSEKDHLNLFESIWPLCDVMCTVSRFTSDYINHIYIYISFAVAGLTKRPKRSKKACLNKWTPTICWRFCSWPPWSPQQQGSVMKCDGMKMGGHWVGRALLIWLLGRARGCNHIRAPKNMSWNLGDRLLGAWGDSKWEPTVFPKVKLISAILSHGGFQCVV